MTDLSFPPTLELPQAAPHHLSIDFINRLLWGVVYASLVLFILTTDWRTPVVFSYRLPVEDASGANLLMLCGIPAAAFGSLTAARSVIQHRVMLKLTHNPVAASLLLSTILVTAATWLGHFRIPA